MARPIQYVPNPCGGRKPVQFLTDRAKRYRANSPECRPADPKRCIFCGSGRNVGVHHLDGDENNGRPSNLEWACKSCNTVIGQAMARLGIGKRTRQYNPKQGAETLAQFAHAVSLICRHRDQAAGRCSPSQDKDVLNAVQLIRDTPAARRRRFASEAASKRGRFREAVPF